MATLTLISERRQQWPRRRTTRMKSLAAVPPTPPPLLLSLVESSSLSSRCLLYGSASLSSVYASLSVAIRSQCRFDFAAILALSQKLFSLSSRHFVRGASGTQTCLLMPKPKKPAAPKPPPGKDPFKLSQRGVSSCPSYDDSYWEAEGKRIARKIRKDNKYAPFITTVGRGQLCVCAAEDICIAWLETFERSNVDANGAPQAGLIISCGEETYHNIDRAIYSRNMAERYWPRTVWLFGHFRHRSDRFWEILEDIRSALDDGKAVILHCRAGIHRAAFVFARC